MALGVATTAGLGAAGGVEEMPREQRSGSESMGSRGSMGILEGFAG
jgi:hypothetical protein